MSFENIDYIEVGKYLAVSYEREELKKANVISCIPNRNVETEGRARRKPGIAYLDTDTYYKKDNEKEPEKTTEDKWSK